MKTGTKELKPSISVAFQSDLNFLPKSSFLKTISVKSLSCLFFAFSYQRNSFGFEMTTYDLWFLRKQPAVM